MLNNFLMPREYTNKWFRGLELALGTVFLFSAISKILEINRFCVQIYAYGVITHKELLPVVAVFTILIEISLSFLLLFNFPYKKITNGVTLLLLLSFTFLIGYGWYFNNLKDCGCFGKIEIGPVPSILKNFILMAVAGSCFWGAKEITDKSREFRIRRFWIPLAVIWAVTLMLSINNLHQDNNLQTTSEQKNTDNPYASLKIEIDGESYDLSRGEYLIALFSFGCEHCMEQAPKVNEYILHPEIPKVIALCLEESTQDKEEFLSKVQPTFKVYSLGNRIRLFFNMIGKEPPRLVYLKDGKVIKFWDYELPTWDQLIHELSEIQEEFVKQGNSS